jgi:LmbE family N-acetylglucosaminyl deacetylase
VVATGSIFGLTMITEEQFVPFHCTDLTGNRVLVLAPHPDDETFGCGGTLALHAAAGDSIRVVILTNGAKGDVFGRFDRDDYIAMRQQEARAACSCLGISDVIFWHYEDRELANSGTVVPDLTGLIDTYCPDLIYAPSPLEFHPDHRAAADFVQTALNCCRTNAQILYYEVGQPMQVEILVDITGVLDIKKQALCQYRSQLEERPYDDMALSLNRFRSLTLSKAVTHAEGFVRCRPSGIKAGYLRESSDKPVAASRNDCSGYAIAVIVRTQGIRQSLLKEALTSISSQANSCLAVIVVHAGAEMLEVVETACREIPSLSWVLVHAKRIENKRGYPLNVGLQYVFSFLNDVEAIAFLDDDDILYSDFSDRMLQSMRETGADVICAASNRSVPGQAAEEGYQPVSFPNLFVLNFIPINSYIIRLASIVKTPVFFDETLDVAEDWHFLLKLLQIGFRFEAIMDILSEFRIISDGNKKIKDDPEKWENAYSYIHAFIRGSSFLLHGQMIQQMMMDQHRTAAENQENMAVMQKRLDELESVLSEKTDPVASPCDKDEQNSSELQSEFEPSVICHKSWGEKVRIAVKRWFPVS